jgi:hypothetical protein
MKRWRTAGRFADVLQAEVEFRRITYEPWHTELNPQRQAAVLNEVFGGAV